MEVVIDGKSVMSVEEAAEIVGRSRATVWRWIQDGKVSTVKTSNRTYVPSSEVEKFKKASRE